jgi:outer membrane autotransporter protein
MFLFFSSAQGGLPRIANVVATCTPAPAPGPGPQTIDRTQSVTKAFLLGRINGILLNDPTNTSLLNRGTSQGGPMTAMANSGINVASNGSALGGSGISSAMGLGVGDATGAGTAGAQTIQFRTSLSQVARDAAKARDDSARMALGSGSGGSLPLAYESGSPWDVWAEGRYSGFNDDAANLGRDGHVGVLYVGSDYRVTHDVIIGALVQFDWAKDTSSLLQSDISGNGWMAGPYLSARLHENIYFDLRAAWGTSSNDLALGATTGGFDTSRWLVKGALAGNWLYDCWRITPSAELFYVTESQDAFTNSAGTNVASQDVSLGRLQFGPEVGYRFAHTADTFIEPFAALKGVWDFDNPNVAIIDGIAVGPGDFWGRLEGGLNVMTADGWLVRGLASWDGVGSNDYNGYTLQGTVNVPLN